jgi:hypothetical protein
MASTMFDSVLYRDVFSTPAMRAVFSDEAQLKAYVQAEVALAVAQGEAGVIPREAAEAIAQKAPTIVLDSEQLKRDTENVGYPIVGLVRQLSQQLGEAGRYVHWGATTQDIMDTATVLQLREAVVLIEAQLIEVMATLADLARRAAAGGRVGALRAPRAGRPSPLQRETRVAPASVPVAVRSAIHRVLWRAPPATPARKPVLPGDNLVLLIGRRGAVATPRDGA